MVEAQAPLRHSKAPTPSLLATVNGTLDAHDLLPRRCKVLVACSGGRDSTAMLHVLHRLAPANDWTLVAVTVDHGLREEAPREMRLVGDLCAKLCIPAVKKNITVAPGGNLQARARDARHRVLRCTARSVGASHIALGHTLDDQAETVLLRLLRGAGLRGLGAMDFGPVDDVVRPLLDATRDQVTAYVRHHDLAHADDPSNEDTRFDRVRVRHELLPQLMAVDPRVKQHLSALAEESRQVQAYLRTWTAEDLRCAQIDGNALSSHFLRELPWPRAVRVLQAWLRPLRPGRAHLEAVRKALQSQGEVWLGQGVSLHIRGGRVQRWTEGCRDPDAPAAPC